MARRKKHVGTGNNNARGTAGRTGVAARRVSSYPLPPAPGLLTDTQKELVHEVIALADAADLAEAARSRRRPRSEFNAASAPEFGSDVSNHLPSPETHELMAFIDHQSSEERTLLIAVEMAGRDHVRLTTSVAERLMSIAAASADHAGSYMASKTHLARNLREGLWKFATFSAGMRRRWKS